MTTTDGRLGADLFGGDLLGGQTTSVVAPVSIFTPTTDAWYDRLPEFMRDADDLQANPTTPLLRFISLVGNQLDAANAIAARISYVSPVDGGPFTGPGSTSDLVNPATADDAWIPWLAQLVGIDPTGRTAADLRYSISHNEGWKTGTLAALITAVEKVLPLSTDPVLVVSHYGNQWTIYVGVRNVDAPDLTAVIAAAEKQKPAGAVLEVDHGINTWGSRQTNYPTWATLPATWDLLEDTA